MNLEVEEAIWQIRYAEPVSDHLLEVLHNVAAIEDTFLDPTVCGKHCVDVFTSETVCGFAEVCAEEGGRV